MPTYFFSTSEGSDFVDRAGTELPDDAAAHCEAIRLSGALLSQEPELLLTGRAFRTEVADEACTPLFAVVSQSVTAKGA